MGFLLCCIRFFRSTARTPLATIYERDEPTTNQPTEKRSNDIARLAVLSETHWGKIKFSPRVRSRSLEMAPFDRSHTSSYSPS